MEVHLTFDTSVSAHLSLDLEAIHELTGLKAEILSVMAGYELEDLIKRVPDDQLKALAKAEFRRESNLTVSDADIELAVVEVY